MSISDGVSESSAGEKKREGESEATIYRLIAFNYRTLRWLIEKHCENTSLTGDRTGDPRLYLFFPI